MTTFADLNSRPGRARYTRKTPSGVIAATEAEALTASGTLRDGFTMHVPTHLMDGRSGAKEGVGNTDPMTAIRDRAEGARDAAFTMMNERTTHAWRGADGMAIFSRLTDKLPAATAHLPRKELALTLGAVGRLEIARTAHDRAEAARDLRAVGSHLAAMADHPSWTAGMTTDGPSLLRGIAQHLTSLADAAEGAR